MITRKIWDVAVIGAGPAGATTSYCLSSDGFEVLLLDKDHFPRAKPCGGALSRKVKKFLPLEFDSVKGSKVFGAEFSFKGSDPFRIEVPDFIAKLVHREDFDKTLLDLSTGQGTNFMGGEKVVRIQRERNFMRLTTLKGTIYTARVVIGADGPRGLSARFLNPKHTVPMGIAIEEEVEIEGMKNLKLAYLDFGRFPWGYGWVFPKEGLSSVGCGAILRREKIPLKEEFERMKRGFDFLPGQVKGKRSWLLPYFGGFPYRRADDHLLLVGDAARFMDPFLGEGIYYAMASGTFAAETVKAAFERKVNIGKFYMSLVQKEIIEELKHAVRMAEFVYPRLQLGFHALRHSKKLGLLYVDVMSGILPYRKFNKGLFRTMKEVGKKKLTNFFPRGDKS